MINKVLLYRPAFPNVSPKSPNLLELYHYPLGLLNIAAQIKKSGFNVQILDEILLQEAGKSLENFLDNISLVGITGYITQHKIMLLTAERIKTYNPNIIVTFGGPHVTLTKDLLAKSPYVDYIIQGEGEFTFSKLIDRLDNNRQISDIDGLIFKENKRIKINKPRFIENLDNLPIPAFELSNLKTYYDLFMKKYDELGAFSYPRSYRIPLEGSRGCPVACNFCSARTILGSKWRTKTPERLIQEILRVEELFPKIFHADDTYITFVDNNFTTSKKHVLNFCSLKKKSKIDIPWAALTRATDLTYDLLKAMVNTGFFATYIGGESGDPDSLLNIGKKYKIDSTINAVKACIKANVQRIIVSFIVGFPFENMIAIKNTLEYAYKLRELAPDRIIISIYKATPFPSTPLWKELESQGKLSPNLENYDPTIAKGLVFDHPIFGYEAKELDILLALWKKLTALKILESKFVDHQLSFQQFVQYMNRIIFSLKSIGLKQIPRITVYKLFDKKQLLALVDTTIKKIENFIFD
ncbi:MAG: B12-binding domain-containing radical SAM protein [Candidatus Helarchaeota archaeon]